MFTYISHIESAVFFLDLPKKIHKAVVELTLGMKHVAVSGVLWRPSVAFPFPFQPLEGGSAAMFWSDPAGGGVWNNFLIIREDSSTADPLAFAYRDWRSESYIFM